MGAGFYPSIDDIGPDRDPIAPRTLEFLAEDFTAQGYDLKRLFRVIMRTKTYQLPSRSRSEDEPIDFRTTYPQRLRSDQLFNALIMALDIPLGRRMTVGTRTPAAGLARDPSYLFATVFGYDPSDPRDLVTSSVPQALLLMNSNILTSLIGSDRRIGLGQLLREIPDDRELVEELYLRTLSRLPVRQEIQDALRHRRGTRDRADAFEDLLWALVNCTEFSYRI
jgi:hypothetical protein